jgi:putative transposase
MRHGFMYLTAVIDWFSRYVLSRRLSNTLDGRFCLEALDEALSMGRPEIFNTDQGSQFTAQEYTGRLEEAGIAVSRDGRGRAGVGQRVRGAAVEKRQIRRHLHQGR